MESPINCKRSRSNNGLAVTPSSVVQPLIKISCFAVIVDTNIFMDYKTFMMDLVTKKHTAVDNVKLYIPWTVMTELDGIKDNKSGQKREDQVSKAREALRMINKWYKEHHPRVVGQTPDESRECSSYFPVTCNDDRILQCCIQYQKKYKDHSVTLLTSDIGLQAKAMVSGIQTCDIEGLTAKLSGKQTMSGATQALCTPVRGSKNNNKNSTHESRSKITRSASSTQVKSSAVTRSSSLLSVSHRGRVSKTPGPGVFHGSAGAQGSSRGQRSSGDRRSSDDPGSGGVQGSSTGQGSSGGQSNTSLKRKRLLPGCSSVDVNQNVTPTSSSSATRKKLFPSHRSTAKKSPKDVEMISKDVIDQQTLDLFNRVCELMRSGYASLINAELAKTSRLNDSTAGQEFNDQGEIIKVLEYIKERPYLIQLYWIERVSNEKLLTELISTINSMRGALTLDKVESFYQKCKRFTLEFGSGTKYQNIKDKIMNDLKSKDLLEELSNLKSLYTKYQNQVKNSTPSSSATTTTTTTVSTPSLQPSVVEDSEMCGVEVSQTNLAVSLVPQIVFSCCGVGGQIHQDNVETAWGLLSNVFSSIVTSRLGGEEALQSVTPDTRPQVISEFQHFCVRVWSLLNLYQSTLTHVMTEVLEMSDFTLMAGLLNETVVHTGKTVQPVAICCLFLDLSKREELMRGFEQLKVEMDEIGLLCRFLTDDEKQAVESACQQ